MAADALAPAHAFPGNSLRERLRGRIEHGLSAEAAAGRQLALRGRTVALVAIALLVAILSPYPGVLFYEALIFLLMVLGFGRFALERSGLFRGWHDYLLIALDCGLLAFTLLCPNPLTPFDYPPQLGLHFGNFAYFYVLLAGLAIGFQPKRVLWGGAMGALAWLIGVAWLTSLPGTILDPPGGDGFPAMLEAMFIPTFIDLSSVVEDVAVFMIVAALMATVVARSRRLVERQSLLERQRSNLARYFPPATVDRLANQDKALAQTREEDAAVLFFDLVGFTHWAERHSPAEVIRMLREVHARIESAVFAHDGTLDKFIGDGAMATFGTVEHGPREATNALSCAVSIVDAFDNWIAQRSRLGQMQLRISIGVHYGRVVVGDVGTDRRMEFGVLGDAVNVASRLEELTRELKSRAAISRAVADAAREETGGEAAALISRFRDCGQWKLRGREQPVDVLAYG
jgi:adenylate cyclase